MTAPLVARRALVPLVAVVLVLGALAVLRSSDDDDPGPEQARLEVVEGAATVTTGTGETETTTGEVILDFGDTITIDAGTAVLVLADGSTYELRRRSDEASGTSVVVGAPPTLTDGDVLVTGGYPAQIRFDTATLTAQGALAVEAESMLATAYAGRTRVAGAGGAEEVLGLRQLLLAPSAEPEPIAFDGTDEWDRRFLGEAIAFGERLEALARGYTNDLQPGGGRSVDFFQAVIPALVDEREFNSDLLDPDRPPGETLVGAAIAVQARTGEFRTRWAAIFDFRAAGAAWGLVALDQGVSSAPVLDTIELAISGPAPTSPPATTTTTGPTATSTSTSTSSSSTTTTTTTTTAPPPSGGLLDPVTDPTGEILRDLLEVLGLGAP